MPTFAFPESPQSITRLLRPRRNAPLPIFLSHSFGDMLNARLLSTHGRSTSELLRTL